jgi:hypothetical protein
MLTPEDGEMEQIMEMGLKSGVLEKRISMAELLDRRFIPKIIRPANITVSEAPKVP